MSTVTSSWRAPTCPSNLVENAAIGNNINILELGSGGCTRANNNPAP
jgi:hypothetical protein